jgi:hypothetical protein
MKGLSAVGQHLMERTNEMIEARMSKTFNDYSAFEAPRPQPPTGAPPTDPVAYTSVFKRMQQSERDPRPAAKKMRFIDQIGKHD